MNIDTDKIADEVVAFWKLLHSFLGRCSYATYSFHTRDVCAENVIETVMYRHGLGELHRPDYNGIRLDVAKNLDARTEFAAGFFHGYDRYDLGLETEDELERREEAE